MNDKQLAQIDEWLSGHKRYKLLDCECKELLKLKGSLLRVLLAQFMGGDDNEESWLSNSSVMELTGLSEKAVINARKELIKDGWMQATGETAAQKYEKPTRGARQVKVYSLAPVKFTPVKSTDKVYGYGSRSESATATHSGTSTREDGNYSKQNQKPKAKPTPAVPCTPLAATPTKVKQSKLAKDGTPWPDDFDSWTNPERCRWLEDHDPSKPKREYDPEYEEAWVQAKRMQEMEESWDLEE